MTPLFAPVEKCSGIYIIINSVNGNTYVGSSANVIKRVWAHLSRKKGSQIVAAAIAKHGIDKFYPFLLERDERDRLPERESYWISIFRPEYNATLLTATGGRIVSEQQREKLRRAQTGKKLTPENRQSIRVALIGRNVSEETRSKIRVKLLGRRHRPESIEKMRSVTWTDERRKNASAAATGRVVSLETRARKSASLKGKPWSAARRAASMHPDLGFIDKHYRA